MKIILVMALFYISLPKPRTRLLKRYFTWRVEKITFGSVRKNGFLIIANSVPFFLTTESNLAIINESDLRCFIMTEKGVEMCVTSSFFNPLKNLRQCTNFFLIQLEKE